MVQTVLAQSAGTRARLQSLTAPLWQQHGWIHCSAGNVHVHVPLRFVFFQRQDQVGGKDSFSSKFICFNYYSYWEWTMECFLDLSWPKPSLSSVFPWPYPVTLGKLSLLLSFLWPWGLVLLWSPAEQDSPWLPSLQSCTLWSVVNMSWPMLSFWAKQFLVQGLRNDLDKKKKKRERFLQVEAEDGLKEAVSSYWGWKRFRSSCVLRTSAAVRQVCHTSIFFWVHYATDFYFSSQASTVHVSWKGIHNSLGLSQVQRS